MVSQDGEIGASYDFNVSYCRCCFFSTEIPVFCDLYSLLSIPDIPLSVLSFHLLFSVYSNEFSCSPPKPLTPILIRVTKSHEPIKKAKVYSDFEAESCRL